MAAAKRQMEEEVSTHARSQYSVHTEYSVIAVQCAHRVQCDLSAVCTLFVHTLSRPRGPYPRMSGTERGDGVAGRGGSAAAEG
eukprot:1321084-Rhodomonas_salina.2